MNRDEDERGDDDNDADVHILSHIDKTRVQVAKRLKSCNVLLKQWPFTSVVAAVVVEQMQYISGSKTSHRSFY